MVGNQGTPLFIGERYVKTCINEMLRLYHAVPKNLTVDPDFTLADTMEYLENATSQIYTVRWEENVPSQDVSRVDAPTSPGSEEYMRRCTYERTRQSSEDVIAIITEHYPVEQALHHATSEEALYRGTLKTVGFKDWISLERSLERDAPLNLQIETEVSSRLPP